MGRPWLAFWGLPYPNERGPLWVNVRSPLLWDVASVTTYLIASTVYLYLPLIPDIAILRDQLSTRHRFYRALALGWTGTEKQQRLLNRAIAAIVLSLPA